MGSLDDLATAGVERAKTEWGKQGDKWFNDVITKAQDAVSGISDPSVRAGAEAGVEALNRHKDELLHLGVDGLTALVGFIAMGSDKRAEELLSLANDADLDTLLAASEASTDKVLAAQKPQDAAIATIKTTIRDIGVTAARAALPLLLAAV